MIFRVGNKTFFNH